MNFLPGQTLANRYRIDRQVGRGGTAVVYNGFDPVVDRVVAIKTFPPHVLGDKIAAEQFLTELQSIGRLEHPHILPIYDCGREGDTPFIIMRYADKGSLADELERGLPTLARAIEVTDQVARALSYAHQRDMIHRDVKPQNIFVEAGDDVYLGDFSLAVLMPNTQSSADTGQVTTGTAYYMSPEQCQSRTLDSRADIYSLGATLYEMSTGHRPYEGPNWAAIMIKVMTEDPPLPRTLNPDLPEAVQDVILKAMARNPDERYATALDLSRALKSCLP